MSDSPIRILLADRHHLSREAIARGLDAEADLEVTGHASDGLEAVSQVEQLRPDVAIVEVSLPGVGGIQTTYLIREQAPACRVIVLGDAGDADTLVAAVDAGASGFVTKDEALAKLVDSIRAVERGEIVIPADLLGELLDLLVARRRFREDASRRLERLTRRERQVLALLARGATNETIARDLVISPQTARTHVQNVFPKLGVHSRLEAAAFVREHGVMNELQGADA